MHHCHARENRTDLQVQALNFALFFFLTSLRIERDKNSAQPVSKQICFLRSCFKDPEDYSERENNKCVTSVRAGTETLSHVACFWISA